MVKKGQIIIIALVFLTITAIIATTLFSRTAGFSRFGATNLRKNQARQLAEAAVNKALWQLNETAGAYPGETNTSLGSVGTFTIQITENTPILKTITATGYVPDSTNPRAKITIKVDAYVGTDTVSFNYALQTGSGGINSMSGGSIINGNVWAGYLNGPVTNIVGEGNSQINGDAYTTGTISSPPDLTVNPEPNSRHPNQDPATAPTPPTLDYQAWRDAAGTTPCDTDGSISNSVSIGPCKQTGDLSISGPGTIVTVQGPIYITGALLMSGGVKLKLADSFGSSDTVIVVDGTINISGNSAVQSNDVTPPKGYILLATTNTTSSALTVSGGSQTGIFYAIEPGAYTTLSGGVHLTGLVTDRLVMSGGSILDYDIGLASNQFTSGPGGSWQIKKGTYRFTSSP